MYVDMFRDQVNVCVEHGYHDPCAVFKCRLSYVIKIIR